MGSSVSMASSPEPEDEDQINKAVNILNQQHPLRLAPMMRLCRLIGDMDQEEKLRLLNAGVIHKLVLMIVERSANVIDGGKNALQRRVSKIAEATSKYSRVKFGRNGFVTQITTAATGAKRRYGNAVAQTNKNSSQEKAPGVGYGYGSTRSRWDVERVIEESILREEQLVWLMNCLTAFFFCASPDFSEPVECFKKHWSVPQLHITPELIELIRRSTIVASFDCHIRNESLFDVSERIDFYQSLFELTASMCLRPALADILAQHFSGGVSNRSVYSLTGRFCQMFAAYSNPAPSSSPLKSRMNEGLTPGSATALSAKFTPATSPDYRLVDLTCRAEKCCRLINLAVQTASRSQSSSTVSAKPMGDGQNDAAIPRLPCADADDANALSMLAASRRRSSIDTKGGVVLRSRAASLVSDVRRLSLPEESSDNAESEYISVMKPIQISTYKFIGDFGKLLANFAFAKDARSLNPFSPALKERCRRIGRELASLQNALPLCLSNGIFVCVDESRCDIIKVLITGPEETPYQNGLFEFDLFFPSTYPLSPPKLSFLTTANGEVRFNPNLYQDGKICLSILNTWEGRPEEKWNPFCSLLQVLVSIQALIFVKDPYFNEPGFERSFGTEKGTVVSKNYNLQLQQLTLSYAIYEQLKNPPEHFREVIRRHCRLKKAALEAQADRWVQEARIAHQVRLTRENAVKNGNNKKSPTTAVAATVQPNSALPQVVAAATTPGGSGGVASSAATTSASLSDLLHMATATDGAMMSSSALANYVSLKGLEKTAENLKRLLHELIERP